MYFCCIYSLLSDLALAMTHRKRACQSSEGWAMWFQVLTVSVGLVFQSGVAMATVTINQYRMTAALAAGKAWIHLHTLSHLHIHIHTHTDSQMGGIAEKWWNFLHRAKWHKGHTGRMHTRFFLTINRPAHRGNEVCVSAHKCIHVCLWPSGQKKA